MSAPLNFKDWTPEKWAHACTVAAKVLKEREHGNPALEKAMEYLAGLFNKAQRSETREAMILILPRK